jgi:hypothetical protein
MTLIREDSARVWDLSMDFFGWWLHNKGCGRCMVGGGLRDWGGGV